MKICRNNCLVYEPDFRNKSYAVVSVLFKHATCALANNSKNLICERVFLCVDKFFIFTFTMHD